MTFLFDSSSQEIPLRWKDKIFNKKNADSRSSQKIISYYEKLYEKIAKKLNEKQGEIADLWLTIKRIETICKIYEESGIQQNTLKEIVSLTQRH